MKRTFEAVKNKANGAWEAAQEAMGRASAPLVKIGATAAGAMAYGQSFAAGLSPVTDPAALLSGIDFTVALTSVLGVVAGGIVYYVSKGGGVQVMLFVKRILSAH